MCRTYVCNFVRKTICRQKSAFFVRQKYSIRVIRFCEVIYMKLHVITKKFKGSEGWITTYAFRLLGKNWIVSISETKWHDGPRNKRNPIWFSKIEKDVPAIFIHKIAIGFKAKSK